MTIAQCIQNFQQKNKTDIIFDFDETICTLHIDWGSWHSEMTSFARSYDPDFGDMFNNVARNASVRSLGSDFWEKLVEKNIECEGKYYSGHTWSETCVELVRECVRAGLRVHLWTSNCQETVEPVMGEKGMDNGLQLRAEDGKSFSDLFTHKVFYNDLMCIKPSVENFFNIRIRTTLNNPIMTL